MFIHYGKECREGSKDSGGYRYDGSKSVRGADGKPDADSFAKSDSESITNAEWKSTTDAISDGVAKSFTRGANAKPDSESQSKSRAENVRRVFTQRRKSRKEDIKKRLTFFAAFLCGFTPLREISLCAFCVSLWL